VLLRTAFRREAHTQAAAPAAEVAQRTLVATAARSGPCAGHGRNALSVLGSMSIAQGAD
jgi:hypothetical protein